jgi:hypothetical protein
MRERPSGKGCKKGSPYNCLVDVEPASKKVTLGLEGGRRLPAGTQYFVEQCLRGGLCARGSSRLGPMSGGLSTVCSPAQEGEDSRSQGNGRCVGTPLASMSPLPTRPGQREKTQKGQAG